jgi:hypothetical protein
MVKYEGGDKLENKKVDISVLINKFQDRINTLKDDRKILQKNMESEFAELDENLHICDKINQINNQIAYLHEFIFDLKGIR